MEYLSQNGIDFKIATTLDSKQNADIDEMIEKAVFPIICSND